MIRKFNFRDTDLYIKTNMLKEGTCYFGERNIMAEFERIQKLGVYSSNTQTTTEQRMVFMYNEFTKIGIKPYKLVIGSLTYEGARMTDFGKQKKLEE